MHSLNMAEPINIEPMCVEDGEIDEEEDMEEGEILQDAQEKISEKRGDVMSTCKETFVLAYTRTLQTSHLPTKAYEWDAAYDLYSPEKHVLYPGTKKLINTGIRIALPPNVYGHIVSRSGLSFKKDIEVVGGGGIIDAGYHGQIYVALRNLSRKPYEVQIGARIAQILFVPCLSPTWFKVDFAAENHSQRGEKSFGSSGGY